MQAPLRNVFGLIVIITLKFFKCFLTVAFSLLLHHNLQCSVFKVHPRHFRRFEHLSMLNEILY